MTRAARPWVVVLAGGNGTRLSSLTTGSDGVSVPKQFCSFDGTDSLLQGTLRRAMAITTPDRVLAVVNRHHENWWLEELVGLPATNVLVQPEGRGTAVAVLLGLLHVLRRDPDGVVVVLPADHHVENEALLRESLVEAAGVADERRGRIVLLGVTPDEPDPELGWILPATGRLGAARDVVGFVEKPSLSQAAALMRRGALCSSFMLAAHASALLRALGSAMPDHVEASMGRIRLLTSERPVAERALVELYADLPSRDFSRDVLEHERTRLLVIGVPACGWTDLGTPARVAQWWRRRGTASQGVVTWPRRRVATAGPASTAAIAV